MLNIRTEQRARGRAVVCVSMSVCVRDCLWCDYVVGSWNNSRGCNQPSSSSSNVITNISFLQEELERTLAYIATHYIYLHPSVHSVSAAYIRIGVLTVLECIMRSVLRPSPSACFILHSLVKPTEVKILKILPS